MKRLEWVLWLAPLLLALGLAGYHLVVSAGADSVGVVLIGGSLIAWSAAMTLWLIKRHGVRQSAALDSVWNELGETERAKECMLEAAATVCMTIEPETRRTLYLTGNARRILGIERQHALDNPDWWFSGVHEGDLAAARANRVSRYQPEIRHRYRFRHASHGKWIWIEETMSLQRGVGTWLATATLLDITASQRIETSLRAEQRRLRSILDAAQLGTWELDVRTGAYHVNDRWAHMLGHDDESCESLTLETITTFVHEDDRERFRTHVTAHPGQTNHPFEATVRMQHRQGHWLWVRISGAIVRHDGDGRPEWICGVQRDISDEMQSRHRLEQAATSDSLTEVANRGYFIELIDREIAAMNRWAQRSALLMIDLDHFKHVNDEHGHAAGDRVLTETVRRIHETLRPRDVIGRLGGEEFGVLLADCQSLEGALVAAERIRCAIAAAPIDCDGVAIPVTASIGMTLLQLLDTPNTALPRADEALYEAKEAGRNRVVVTQTDRLGDKLA